MASFLYRSNWYNIFEVYNNSQRLNGFMINLKQLSNKILLSLLLTLDIYVSAVVACLYKTLGEIWYHLFYKI